MCTTALTTRNEILTLAAFSGSVPVSLQLRFKGPVEKPAAGGSDQTLRQLEEWSQ